VAIEEALVLPSKAKQIPDSRIGLPFQSTGWGLREPREGRQKAQKGVRHPGGTVGNLRVYQPLEECRVAVAANQVEGKEPPEGPVYRTPLGLEAEGPLLEAVPGDKTILEEGPTIAGKEEAPAPIAGDDFRRRDDDSSGVDVRKECRQNSANLVPPSVIKPTVYAEKKVGSTR